MIDFGAAAARAMARAEESAPPEHATKVRRRASRTALPPVSALHAAMMARTRRERALGPPGALLGECALATAGWYGCDRERIDFDA